MTYKFQQIKPQKARGKLLESMWTDPNWVAEEKYDGDRRIAQFIGGAIRFTGSQESVKGGFVEKTDNLVHLWPGPLSLTGTVLDGEILPPLGTKIVGGGSKYVTKVMGSLPAEAIRKQKATGWLRYVVFDCLYYKGKDMRSSGLLERKIHAIKACEEWSNKYVAPVSIGADEGKKSLFDKIIKRGGEGVILKHKDHTYGNEKLWVKVKGVWTADVVVAGFIPGKGKNAGKVGSIIIGQYTNPRSKNWGIRVLGSVRGFTDDLMNKMTAHPAKYKGRVLRITHNGREPTGAFRHPQFDDWRTDKSPKDCIYDPEET